MEFGVPSKKRVKTEKYPNTAVITLAPFEGENTSRKILFNNKAYEALGLTKGEINLVAFSFNKSDFTDNKIVNAATLNSDASLKISKNGTLSNKSHYEEIKTRYNVPMAGELELTVVDSGKEFAGVTVFDLVTLESVQQATSESESEEETAPETVEGTQENVDPNEPPLESYDREEPPVEAIIEEHVTTPQAPIVEPTVNDIDADQDRTASMLNSIFGDEQVDEYDV
jgi:hypothetical protein